MAESITDVAAFILTRTGTIPTMKLHKLAYYAQAAHIVAHNGAPLFPEDFYAWRSGPKITMGVYYWEHRILH